MKKFICFATAETTEDARKRGYEVYEHFQVYVSMPDIYTAEKDRKEIEAEAVKTILSEVKIDSEFKAYRVYSENIKIGNIHDAEEWEKEQGEAWEAIFKEAEQNGFF